MSVACGIGEEFGPGWSGRGRVEYGFGADLGQSGSGVAGEVETVNSRGDAGGTLDLMGKAVPAALLQMPAPLSLGGASRIGTGEGALLVRLPAFRRRDDHTDPRHRHDVAVLS